MAIIKLAATTSALPSDPFTIQTPSELPVSITAPGLSGAAEYVTLQYFDGTSWHDYYEDDEATPKRITDKNSMLSVYAPGIWRGNKTATVAPVAINIHTHISP